MLFYFLSLSLSLSLYCVPSSSSFLYDKLFCYGIFKIYRSRTSLSVCIAKSLFNFLEKPYFFAKCNGTFVFIADYPRPPGCCCSRYNTPAAFVEKTKKNSPNLKSLESIVVVKFRVFYQTILAFFSL